MNLDIGRGEEVVGILERSGLRISVAVWMYSSEHEDWRLFLAGRSFDGLDITSAYMLLNRTLREAGFPSETKPTVMILPRNDAFVRDLRRIFGKTKSVQGMRLGGQRIGDRFVQDAYVYRIS